MTVVVEVEAKCAVCGATSKHEQAVSSSTFGQSDLDTRPPELIRSTIDFWVQRCPGCGYCWWDISQASEVASQVVRTEEYRAQAQSPDFPALANAFLCSCIVHRVAGDLAGAGWAAVRAAWACDDKAITAGAIRCRNQAVALFQTAREKGQTWAQQEGVEELVVADLLRRSSRFAEAATYCDAGLLKAADAYVQRALRREKELVSASDAACHPMPPPEQAPDRRRRRPETYQDPPSRTYTTSVSVYLYETE